MSNLVGVCDLLDKLSTVDSEKVARAAAAREAQLIKTVEPNPDLITPMEPDFVSNNLNMTAGGHPVSFDALYEAYVDGEIIYLSGPTGAGKTTIARALVDRANRSRYEHNRKAFAANAKLVKSGTTDPEKLQPYLPIEYVLKMVQGHEESRSVELIGDTGLIYDEAGNRHVETMMGAALEAAVEGYTVLVDEADAIPAGVMTQCHGLFDKRVRRMSFWLNGRHDYIKHPRFRVIFSANTKGAGENTAEYAHAQIQSRAMINRVSYFVDVGYMDSASELDLISKRVPAVPRDILDKMVQSASNVRRLYQDGGIDIAMSTRDVESWAREVCRSAKRTHTALSSDSSTWTTFVVPAAGPTVVAKTADKGSAEAIMRELQWR